MRNYLLIRTKAKYFSKLIFVFIILLGFLIFPNYTRAQGTSIMTSDQKAQEEAIKIQEEIDMNMEAGRQNDNWLQTAWELLKKSGSKALSTSLRNALNKIAYDTATYIGSGGRGQKPLFITEDWGTYLTNIADSAAGDFLEQLGRDPEFFGRFNLCEPSADIKLTIGLGLVKQQRPREPVCTFTKMKENWEQELTRDDFLYRFSDMFTPGGNDLSIAFGIHTNYLNKVIGEVDKKILERTENEGWDFARSLGGDRISPPGQPARDLDFSYGIRAANIGNFTGDALVDASNVFLNQLAITAFQTAMRNLANKNGTRSTSPYDWSSLTLFDSGPRNSGLAGVKDRLVQVINPNFSVRGDYDILAELTMCPNPTKAGPTNCVLTDKFRDAIEEGLTVGEALKNGYFFEDGIFGFKADGLEPTYNEGYPYRSMLILRKFRIIPVGWELAAQHIKEEANKTYSLGNLVNCFDQSDDYEGFHEDWCDGLVDPNWVLKAPLNYCKKEGPGPEIVSESIMGKEDNSKLRITRNDNYCADEQSCIDENDDGSCNIYGYCTEERRGWSFGTSSCDPKYNTCQTFVAGNGSKISYLENTLDYSVCSADNSGCSAYYMQASSFDSATNNVNWNTGGEVIYLDKDASECSPENDGCTQLIRTKAGTKSNLLPNSSFEDLDTPTTFQYWGALGEAESDPFDGYVSLKLNGNSSFDVNIGPSGYDALGEDFSLSIYAKGCGYNSYFGIGEGSIPGSGIASSSLGTTGEWAYYTVTKTMPLNYISNQIELFFNIDPTATNCLVDAIKLERGSFSSGYSSYMNEGLINQKLIPEYMHNVCYSGADNYELRADRPLECDTYSRLCMEDEVGCNLFTSVKNRISVPAKVSSQDYCPDVCVGYDAYLQSGTSFDSPQYQYFIPNTAKTCSAQTVGCDEFTNLDLVDQGGEALEYYTNLKHCIKPADPLANCGEYYSWEGSKETGYRLKVYSLQNGVSGPDVTSDDSLLCSRDIHYANSASPLYNPDCREYYAKDGQVYYNLNSRVITCSENCHPYRRTDDNVIRLADGSNYDQAACVALGLNYDTDQNHCVECINGGVWNPQHNACIYMAVPNEGQTCAAAQSGCREYGGNSGRNTRIILNNNFEGGTQNWQAEGTTNITTSNEALMVGGSSLYVSGAPRKTYFTLGTKVATGNAYVVSFLAKGDGKIANINFRFENSGGDSVSFSQSVNLSASEWNIYEINLLTLDHEVDSAEKIVISADNNFYIDDIRLTSIGDRYYLIKNSWVMPEINGRDICNWDILADGPYPLYSLSCQQYTDKENKPYSLRRFTSLCQESAIGCEVMIDTHNSNYYGQTDIPSAASNPSLPNTVSADNYVYAVYNEKNSCDSVDKGCQRLGKSTIYESQILTQDFYVRNNPDQYDTIVCSKDAVSCDQWSTNDGLSYFKNPGDQICEWRQVPPSVSEQGQIEVWDWYKKKIKRCDINSNKIIESGEKTVCNTNFDCSAVGGNCILDETNYNCTVSNTKTFGFGGSGKVVSQPTVDTNGYWAGTCPTAQSGCTEYIDPVSSFESNHLFNSDFTQNISGPATPADGWATEYQDISLKPYTLYILAADKNIVELAPIPGNPITLYELSSNNTVSPATMPLVVDGSVRRASTRFFTGPNTNIRVRVSADNVSADNGSVVELKRAAIDYQINTGVDRTSCNGQVSFEDGCVLFNERDVNKDSSGIYSSLIWNADATANTGFTGAPSPGNNANSLINVRPDRKCNEWLACRSYVKDENGEQMCYDIDLCDGLDNNGNCNSYVVSELKNYSYSVDSHSELSKDEISNMTGYSKAVYSESPILANYNLGQMTQDGSITNVTNYSFEVYDSKMYPTGWSHYNETPWNENSFSVINNPYKAQQFNVEYPVDGKAFLMASVDNSNFSPFSEFIDVDENTTYYLSAMVNTKAVNSRDSSNVGAYISVFGYDSFGEQIAGGQLIRIEAGKDWEEYTARFTTSNGVSRIKIKIGGYFGNGFAECLNVAGSDKCAGNVFVDNIRVDSILKAGSNLEITQSCRLYPENDSLSCSYMDDSYIKRNGWDGYCLEYDRYPGSTDACVLWYPIDSTISQSSEYFGYKGKAPVYYAIENKFEKVNASYDAFTLNTSPFPHIDYRYIKIEDFEFEEEWVRQAIADDNKATALYDFMTISVGSDTVLDSSNNWSSGCTGEGCNIKTTFEVVWNQWLKYPYETPAVSCRAGGDSSHGRTIGTKADIKIIDGVRVIEGVEVWACDTSKNCCDPTYIPSMKVELNIPYASKIAQTVTPFGENKYWSARVYEGSEYEFPCNLGLNTFINTCEYQTDSAPFGSLTPPDSLEADISNPSTWDSREKLGKQPLYYETSNGQARMGQLIQKADVQKIFAQSYGIWEWNPQADDGQGSYTRIYGQDWVPPQTVCAPAQISPRQYCAIPPTIRNVSVNDNAVGSVSISGTSFVNLKFNSMVDAQQLPITMFSIDWGDGEKTTASGITINSRSTDTNFHSLYHLYSYWDLVFKHSYGDGSIVCETNPVERCFVTPRVKIKDNWGWCNGGTQPNDCDQWVSLSSPIVVYKNQ